MRAQYRDNCGCIVEIVQTFLYNMSILVLGISLQYTHSYEQKQFFVHIGRNAPFGALRQGLNNKLTQLT